MRFHGDADAKSHNLHIADQNLVDISIEVKGRAYTYMKAMSLSISMHGVAKKICFACAFPRPARGPHKILNFLNVNPDRSALDLLGNLHCTCKLACSLDRLLVDCEGGGKNIP